MADISIDEAKAKVWIDDVKSEITEVEGVLKKVTTAVTTAPGEDDDIMQGIESTCQVLSDFWTRMCQGFKSAGSAMTETIERIQKSGQEVIGDINNVKSKVGT